MASGRGRRRYASMQTDCATSSRTLMRPTPSQREGETRVLVVHDSAHGNTEEIARTVGGAITGQVQVIRVGQAKLSDMSTFDPVIIGSPTQGGKTTQAIQNFVNSMPASAGRGSVPAFDTRMSSRWVRVFGYAAGRIANALQRRGWPLAAPSALP